MTLNEKGEMMNALEKRIMEEEVAKQGKCGCIGCHNKATHTWSGHPTCDDCGSPGRLKGASLTFPRLIGNSC